MSESYALSPTQHGMLVESLRARERHVYIEQMHATLRGPLDPHALRDAFQKLVDRHGVLRTWIREKDVAAPLQVVEPQAVLPWELLDWRTQADETQRRDLAALAYGERDRGIDLSRAPLMKVVVVRTADDRTELVWTWHHVLLDGWSAAQIIGELISSYEAGLTGTETPPIVRRPYRDYIAWLGQQDRGAAAACWRDQLSGYSPRAVWPVPRQREQAADGAIWKYSIEADETRRLAEAIRGQRLTVNTVVQGAWALILRLYTGADDVLFGGVVSGRPGTLRGSDRMLGLFINTLPVRARIEPQATVRAWLKALQARQAEARQFEYASLAEIRQWGGLAGGTALFDSMLVFENFPIARAMTQASAAGVSFQRASFFSRTDVPLVVMVTAGETVDLLIQAAAMPYEDVDALGTLLVHTIRQLIAQPAARLARAIGLPAAHAAVIDRANATAAAGDEPMVLHDMFARQAARTPDATAAIDGGVALTYAALDARVERMAWALRDRGVGPDVVVGLCVERSLSFVMGMLAILKAGGAYLPMDPHDPAPRLAFMVEQAGAPIVLTRSAGAAAWPAGVEAIDIDACAPTEPGAARGAIPSPSADALAYVMFTSGSTGLPKGVSLPHRALANLIAWHGRSPVLRQGVRTAQFASTTFDASFHEIFTTWTSGGALVLVSEELRTDPDRLWPYLREQQVARLFLPFVALEQIAHVALRDGRGHPLLEVITAGEQVHSTPAIRGLFARSPDARLHNHYGPTETHVATAYPLAADPGAWELLPSIGQPIANTQAYVLDGDLRPMPVGVEGELYLAGTALARGYVGRPALTADRFVPNPLAASPGGRMYRTGDVARWRADGQLQFLGRRDHQVKVRGYRVELGEIEATLRQHDEVRDAVVLMQGASAARRLIACVMTHRHASASEDDDPREQGRLAVALQAHIRERLPEYMSLAGVVFVDAFPLTASGKVDRAVLAARMADAAPAEAPDAYVTPRTPSEEVVAGIWADVLGRARVGAHDDFFALGGHSLLATQVIWRAREAFGTQFPLRMLFDAPTVAAFAGAIDAASRASTGAAAPAPIVPVPRTSPLPLSHAQYRLWFLEQLALGDSTYHMPLAIRLRGALDEAALRASIDTIVARHEILRTRIVVPAEGQPEPRIEPAVSMRVDIVDTSEDDLANATEAEYRRPFDLAQAPLLRVTLLRLDAADHVLLVVLHHIVADAWSLGILVRELAMCYRAALVSEPPVLPDLPVQYADYAAWQRAWLSSGELETQLTYWRTKLAGPLPVLALPFDRPRPSAPTHAGAETRRRFGADTSAGVRRVSRHVGATPFMTVLAALKAVLARYADQADLVVGTAVAGRTRGETAPLVGCFMNTLVLRTDVSGDPSFRELLGRVRQTALEAYAHQDAPFEKLVEDLQPERDLARTPLFQVMVLMQNAPSADLALGDLRLDVIATEATTAKFDLTFTCTEDVEGIAVSVEYATELFDGITIERLLTHWERLLAAVVADPELPISRVGLLDTDERAQVVNAWNATEVEWPRTSLPELIAVQASATPDAIAVSDDRAAWTYRDLRTRTHEIAAALRSAGVGPERIVAVCVERSAVLVASLLGVLEAGGAYLPLDPSHPAERLAYVIADSGATVLLTEIALAATLPPALTAGARVLLVDDLPVPATASATTEAPLPQALLAGARVPPFDGLAVHAPTSAAIGAATVEEARISAAANGENTIDAAVRELAAIEEVPLETPASSVWPASPISEMSPEALAYVMYTSGSTGRPKGVLISHGALTNFLLAMRARLAVAAEERVLALTTASFDIAGLELFLPLIAGGTCHVGSRATAQDVTQLLAALTAWRPTLVQATPATWTMLAQTGWRNPTGARLLCGGEALPPRLQAWLAATGREAWNLFGPTETTIWSTAARLTPGADTVTIGTPIANTQVYVLDARGRPTPMGVPGELCIGGAGLARGYWRRPALTAATFVPDPFAATPGARLYRTGDRARWRADGRLEFLGRRDTQIKLRGYRIELGEIEETLRQHTAVRDAAVVLHGAGESARLIAYVTPRPADPDPDASRATAARPHATVRDAVSAPHSAGESAQPIVSVPLRSPERTAGTGAAAAARVLTGAALTTAVRGHVRAHLPDYMVPAAILVLDALPLSASGKVDRVALAAQPVDLAALDADRHYVAPRTAVEELLAGIWADVLGRDRVGVHDDFFALGGHSVLATQAIWRARDAFGTHVPLRTLFDAPTVAGLAEAIEPARGAGAHLLPPIVRVPRRDGLPLSHVQQRVWFLQQLEPASHAYHMPLAIRLRGALDDAALGLAIQAIVARHEVLRTRFVNVSGQGQALISEESTIQLEIVDITGQNLAAAIADRCRRPFDVTQAPLVRVTLLGLDATDHVLLVVLHHLVADAWSMGILVRELAVCYRAALASEPADLPALPVQYVDYAAWQRAWLASGELETQLTYWRTKLAGPLPVLALPIDRPRPAVPTHRGAVTTRRFSAAASEGVRRVSRTLGATPFMTVLAPLLSVLARCADQSDVVIGTAVAGRTRGETAPLVGCFMNTLVLRTDVSGDPSFRELLGRVRQTTLDAYAHQDVPFEKLVEDLQPERDLARTPLFQVMVLMQNAPWQALELPGLQLEPASVASPAAKFDLTFSLAEEDGAFAVGVEYATDLFEAGTVQRLLTYWERLLAAAAQAPDLPMSRFALLDADERAQVVTGWNATGMEWPRTSLPELIAAHEAAAPDALAVSDDRATWTYRDLRVRTGRIAAALRSAGVGAEQIVAVCVERSAALVAALLGVLEAGGAYLPLDPSHPADRLAYVMADSGATVLLTETALAGTLPPALTAGMRVLLVDKRPLPAPEAAVSEAATIEEAAIAAAGSGAPLDTSGSPASPRASVSPASPEALAYVMYTSGSTGRPKGVLISRGALTNFLLAMRARLAVGAEERVLALTTASFDIAGLEFYLPLIAGGSCHVASRATAQDVTQLQAALTARRPTLVQATPATWTMLAQAGWQNAIGARLLCGGEALPPRLQAWLTATGREAWNLFGPTETTIWSTAVRLTPGAETVTIGTPIANTQVYVLDARGAPTPIGVPGELVIGGAGLARGYWRRPALTAATFVPDPFASAPGARLYRTGDRARWRADGQLEFLGRRDTQIKLRGYRIELGEIEVTLRQHAAVGDAVVVLHGAGESAQLIAYVTPRPPNPHADSAPDPDAGTDRAMAADARALTGTALAAAVRGHGRTQLPDYMVPAAILVIDALPLNASCKVDRVQLAGQPVDPAALEADRQHVAPRTPVEEGLAGIWADVLGRDRIGVHADFFALGGHSLLAMQVVTRLREVWHVDVPLRALFEAPTVAALAAEIETLRATERSAPPPIPAAPRDAPLPLSFAQQRLWVLQQLAGADDVYAIPAGWWVSGALDRDALSASITALVARHEVLRTTLPTVDGEPVQRIAEPFAVPITVMEAASDAAALAEALAHARVPFDLATGPLWRVRLWRVGADRHLVSLVVHHIVFDAWSTGVLARELAALYPAAQANADLSGALPPLRIQYADFALWQRARLSGDHLAAQVDYWRDALGGEAEERLALPTETASSAAPPSSEGATLYYTCPLVVRQGLEAVSRRAGATLFMTGIAALQALLHRYTGQTAIRVGTPIAGRLHRDTEALIGFFVNALVLRSLVRGERTVDELLSQVRGAALDAYAHQELPFERLVEALQPSRESRGTPLFQVLFAYDERPDAAVDLPAGRWTPVAWAHTSAKFDLMVGLQPTADGLTGYVEYRTALFDRATMARFITHWTTLLAAIAADSSRRIQDLPILSGAEREDLHRAGQGEEAAAPGRETVPSLFGLQAAATPGAPAVEDGGDVRTYAWLDRASSAIAARLRERGVGAGDLVGVCGTPGAGTLAAFLGVWRAGAAYVPLDPAQPPRRLAEMLDDARPALVVGERDTLRHLPDAAIAVEDWLTDPSSSDGAALPAIVPESAAYVLYTSGSTGRPKGVRISHAALAHYVSWAARMYASPGERLGFAWHTSIGFDLTVTSMFVPLVTGDTVVAYRGDPIGVLESIVTGGRAHVVKLTPSHLALLPHGDLSRSTVRRFVVGGESLSTAVAEATVSRFGGRVGILNEYGPTEATVGCMLHRFDPARDRRAAVPIGRAAANTSIRILDSSGQPVPWLVPGEIAIGGPGLADGYAGAPGLTAARFAPDPWTPGGRLYRTGDRARWLPDGNVEYLGRLDTQIKIRGHRIELEEIRAALLRQPTVRDAIVQARHTTEGVGTLVAYYVARQPLAEAKLRAGLLDALAAEMMPARFVHLSKLPLTVHGKVDMTALAALDAPADEPSPGAIPPRTATEAAIAGMWEDLLDRRGIGVEDNFFALGGHSLLLTRVMTRLRDTFGLDVSLRHLFDAPTVAALAAHVDTLRGMPDGVNAIPRAARDLPLRLSYAQQRLWFLHQLAPESSAYHVPVAIRLRGPLDERALSASLQAIVTRHEVLRTRIAQLEGEPVQVVASDAAVPPHLVETTAGALAGVIAQEIARPFDLIAGPVLRVTLIRLDPAEHVLLVVLHHIAADAWSLEILVRELVALYRAEVEGTPAALSELPIQYADHAAWQRRWLDGGELDAQLSYWRATLAGPLPEIALPFDRPRPVLPAHTGAVATRRLDAGVSEGVLRIGRASGATVYMTLLAGLTALLSRYGGGQRDIVIGTAVAGRTRAETTGLVGCFVNTLVLRTDVSGHPSFRELLGRVRQTALDAYAHQDVPFDKLVEDLQPERDPSRPPLFQVMTTGAHGAPRDLSLPGLESQLEPMTAPSAKFDLTFAFGETAGALEIGIEYAAELFDEATIARLAGHLERLLAAAIEQPDAPIAALSFLDCDEQHQLLHAWNDTASPLSSCAVHELFAQQAARTPEAIALLGDRVAWRYRELDARADVIADHLAAAGVAPEHLVGVCLPRSPLQIAALLGVLKAGAAYVPLDPDHPVARLRVMIRDAELAVVLTEAGLRDMVLQAQTVRVLAVDELDARSAAAIAAAPRAQPPVHPDQLAYVMYTSGSTGVPKGVEIPHRAIVRLVSGLPIEPASVHAVLAAAPVGFDASTFEIWGCLLHGATLVLAPAAPSLQDLARTLTAHHVTTAWLTSGLFHQMVAHAPEALRTLSTLIAGGDVLAVPAVQALVASGGPTLINGYGPTETTTFACCHVVRPETAASMSSVPIGRPIGNTRVYVLDGARRIVPIGIVGELYISGRGLARGYRAHPSLTAERFVPHPYASSPGERLYRTGDLVRWRADGVLEFVGRRDDQVKIRGFRVELGEVERALASHPDVPESVVLAIPGPDGTRRLVAFLNTAAGLTDNTLRAFLRESLPDHLVPSGFVRLETFPLTPHGKVDRAALADRADDAWMESADGYTAPRTPAEDVLAGIWAAVLGRERVGIHDNFFEAGGHSLLAQQVTWRAAEAFGCTVPLRAVFEAPTVAELAEAIERERQAQRDMTLPPIEPAPRDRPLPLSSAQQRLWLLDQLDPGNPAYNVALELCLTGSPDRDAIQFALDELVHRHEALRTLFERAGDQPIQRILAPVPVALRLLDLSHLPPAPAAEQARAAIKREATHRFSLATGPLLRPLLIRIDDRQLVLLVVMHHIVCDAWSLGVLTHEFAALYNAHRRGVPAALPAARQYADYAVWQQQVPADEEDLAYWRGKLVDRKPLLLPGATMRQGAPAYEGDVLTFALDGQMTRGIRELGRRAGATPFIVCLAALDALLFRYTGERHVSLGTDVANRSAGTEQMVGFFVNQLVLQETIAPREAFEALLRRVRSSTLDAYRHQAVPFDRIVAEIGPERDARHHPLFQIKLLFQNTPRVGARVDDVAVASGTPDRGTAQHDLLIALTETPGGELHGLVEFATDVYPAPLVAAFTRHYRALLAYVIAHPSTPIAAIPLLSDEEEAVQLRRGRGDTCARSAGERTLPALFRAAVREARHPAIVTPARELSYADLDAESDRLAAYLRTLGVATETVVAVYVASAVRRVTSFLAVLKAGGVYLPLNPSHPPDRIADLLDDARAPLIVTESGIAGSLPITWAQMVTLDEDAEAIAEAEAPDGEGEVDPANLAYIIYTSGSTGKPKPVAVGHDAVCNMTLAQIDVFGIRPGSRVLPFAACDFDACISEWCMALMTGGTLVFPSDDRVETMETIAEALETWGIDALTLPPALLAVTAPPPGRVASLIVAGDVCREGAAAPWLGGRRVFNAYGPTECAVCTSISRPLTAGDPPPIGRPIANLQVYVLDADLGLSPDGVVGQLHVGGVGLARGYRGRGGLTAERFVPNPYAAEPGERLYCTGDFVRWRADGQLQFVGRQDEQVKIRGYRIELREIERVLAGDPAVQDAAVVARPGPTGDPQLVACVVVRDPSVTGAMLRQRVRARLPEYMTPAAFVLNDALPLTTSGKIDREALARRAPPAWTGTDGAYVAPRTPAEEALAAIWTNLLRRERIGVHDNFFEMGGDSIVSIQVVSRANECGLTITQRQMFQHQTIAELAAVAAAAARPAEQGLVTGPVILTPIQRWFLERPLRHRHHYNQAVMLAVDRRLTSTHLDEALAHLLRHHDALRMRFFEEDGEWQQANGGEPSETAGLLRVIDLRDASADVLRTRVAAEAAAAQASLRLDGGQLVRAVWFEMPAPEPHCLLLIVHHLVVDGVSLRILLDDVNRVCSQIVNGASVRLPFKTTSFQQWAARTATLLETGGLDGELAYWLEQARMPAAALPVDGSDGENDTASVRTHAHELTAAETQGLLDSAAQPLVEALIAALVRTLGEWAGGRAVRIDLEGHGREEILDGLDLTRTVGWFTALYPMVFDTDPEWRPEETLAGVAARMREVTHHGIGHGFLRTRHDALAAAPAAEMSFNYLGQFAPGAADEWLLMPTGAPAGPMHGIEGPRTHVLELTGLLAGGRLRFQWTYSSARHRDDTVASLARAFHAHLCSFITVRPLAHTSLAAFPLANLTDASLRTIIDTMRAGQGSPTPVSDRGDTPVSDIEDLYRLSPQQAGLLFQALYERGQAYISQARLTFTGEIDLACLRRAFQTALRRHGVLRSAVLWKNLPEPVQVVMRDGAMPLYEHDWTDASDGTPGDLDAFCQRDRERAFDLERPPLMRAHLIRTADGRATLIWTWHHILLDGWSVAQLVPELLSAYRAAAGDADATPIARRPYRDYIAWLQQQDLSRAKAYWTRRLHGLTAVTPCPLPQSASDVFVFREFELGADDTARLLEAARRLHLTLNTIAQACWALVLNRASGHGEVVFGGVVSGRPPSLSGAETMLGLFINTLPVRVQVDAGTPIGQWLEGIQREQSDARDFEHTPLSELRRWSQLPANGPLFASILVFENFPAPRPSGRPGKAGEPRIETHEAVSYTSFPLTVSIGLAATLQIRLSARHAGPRTDAGLRRLGAQMLELFRTMLADPAATAGTLATAFDRAAAAEAEHERARVAAARERIVGRLVAAQSTRLEE